LFHSFFENLQFFRHKYRHPFANRDLIIPSASLISLELLPDEVLDTNLYKTVPVVTTRIIRNSHRSGEKPSFLML
jgi:hypothetical protein